MKNKGALLSILLISLILPTFLSNILSFVSADTSSTQALQDQLNSAQQTANNIQQTADSIRNQYLSQEWSNVIAKIPVIGQIHSFFMTNQLIFIVLFNEQYSISLTFFLTLLFWMFLLVISYKILKVYFPQSGWKALIISIGIAILVAQATLLKVITASVLKIIMNQQVWWIRLIMWFSIFIILVIFYYIDATISSKIKAVRAAKKRAELERSVSEAKAFVKGVKEGQDLA